MADKQNWLNDSLLLPGILLFVFAIQLVVIFSFNGTCDSGDSIQHYLIARHAFEHPHLFLDHWGKPFFTLLASIPSAFGFVGIKIFNCLLVLWSLANVFLISKRIFPRKFWVATLLLALMPELIRLQFSGLTEPLFAAWLSASLLLVVRGKVSWGFAMVSFLPFIRTEGFLLLPIFALFLILVKLEKKGKKQGAGSMELDRLGGRITNLFSKPVVFKLIGTLSLLTLGTVLYSIVGGIAKGDLTWVFSENPYEHLDNYGSGDWGHFPRKFIFITGVPIYGLWILGMLLGIVALFRRYWAGTRFASLRELVGTEMDSQTETESSHNGFSSSRANISSSHANKWRLIYGLFLAYFGAHVVFWATGLAHSMGLMRVMVSLTPLVALIAARGAFFLIGWLPKPIHRNIFLGLIAAYIIIFPFLPNHASLKLHDFELSPDQTMLDDHGDLYKELEANDLRVYYAHPYVPVAFGFDPFVHPRYMNNLKAREFPPGTMIVWDSWFSVKEAGVPEEFWGQNPDKFLLKEEASEVDVEGNEIKIKFYVAR